MNALKSGIKLQMLLYVQKVPEHVKLRADTNLEPNDVKLVTDVETADPRISVSRLVEAGKLRDQGGLASTIGAEEAK